MSRRHAPSLSHSEYVEIAPLPEAGPVRTAVLNERRRYIPLLAKTLELQTAAYTDSLTGLKNRKYFDEEFPKIFALAKRHNIPLAVGYVDLRGLKRVNDGDGHGKGDSLIKAGGEALGDIARDGDLVARLGGDEFIIVMPGYSPVDEKQTIEGLNQETTNRLSHSYEAAAKEHGIPADRHTGMDMAITVMEEWDTPESMVARADAMMKASKDAYYQQLEIERGIRLKEGDRRLQS